MKSKSNKEKINKKNVQVEISEINVITSDKENQEHTYTDRLLQLHLAEYNALTSRATQQMITVVVLLIGLLSLFGTTIVFLDKLPALTFWVIVFSAQIGGIVAAWLSYEERNVTFYIETTLRQKIEKLLKEDHFWMYEDHLLKNRKRATSFIKYPVFVLALLIIYFVVNNRTNNWSNKDTIGLLINIVVGLIFSYIIYLSFDVQSKMWKHLKGL